MKISQAGVGFDLQAEHAYRYDERLGILCGIRVPTAQEIRIAQSEADVAMAQFEAAAAQALEADMVADRLSNDERRR